MNRAFRKSITRSITGSVGRYLAILAIIALGVGFFTGLKTTRPAMIETANQYVKEHELFDYRVLSSLGFTAEEITNTAKLEAVIHVEGALWQDFIYLDEQGDAGVLKAHSLTKEINRLDFTAGRLPTAPNEAVLDAFYYSEELIGAVIRVAPENTDETKQLLAYPEYTIVGLARSPIYMNSERGTTGLGTGRLNGFIYIPEEGFTFDVYKELYVTIDQQHPIYSDDYHTFIEGFKPELEQRLQDELNLRYEALSAVMPFPLEEPSVYVLTRQANSGYVSFEHDASIVDGMAKIFPIFFFLIAALVCSTTMTRMVDEERTQIGTLLALGYRSTTIMSKYVIYSGTAAVIGCALGYIVGIRLFPYAIWQAYDMLYGFAEIRYVTDTPLFLLSMLVSLLCSVGTTYAACRNELRHVPAELIRPKAPAAGKRILLESIHPLWSRMKFLHKITARNIFRFKKRMLMMIIGIAGCMALVLTGYGIKDSISNIVNYQFDEIMLHDVNVTFTETLTDAQIAAIEDAHARDLAVSAVLMEATVETAELALNKTVHLIATDDPDIEQVVDLHRHGSKVEFPQQGETVISEGLAEAIGLTVGDQLALRHGVGERTVYLTVAGIFENYVYHYAIMTAETYTEHFAKDYEPGTLYLKVKEGVDDYQLAAELAQLDSVAQVSVLADVRSSVANMMNSLNDVVLLVITSAALLAFIVLYNLTNINISERVREIATLKVLGFYRSETRAYVMRESVVLSAMGMVAGLPLGILLHRYVMDQIQIDLVSFEVTILPLSYVYAIVTVLGFTLAVNLMMDGKIEKIQMAESLKSIE